jgi:hypothetical protein
MTIKWQRCWKCLAGGVLTVGSNYDRRSTTNNAIILRNSAPGTIQAVHKETVVACVRLVLDGKITREVRRFETTTSGLLLLLAWLTEMGCTHVAMEATGVYWKPVWNILSDGDFRAGFGMPLTSKMFLEGPTGPQPSRTL